MRVIGHRGASSVTPENTVAAFEAAIELGADGIEFDVQLAADGGPVVMHDALLDRTTNGTGAVFESTVEEIRRLDAGAWFGDEFVGARVPLLDEVLRLPAVEFELELKDYGRTALESVLAAVDRAEVFDRVKFTGWNYPLLAILKQQRPNARVGMFSFRRAPWMTDAVFERYVLGMAETAPADVAHVYAESITPRIVDGLHQLGLEAHANDAVNRDEMQRARDAGADSLSADDVGEAVAVRDGHSAR